MKDFILYLINSAITLSIIYAAYCLLARRLTFYRANRWLLLGGIAASVVLPLVKLPVLSEKLALNTVFLDAVFVSPNTIGTPAGVSGSFSIWQVLFYAYLLVTCVLLFRFAWQLLSLAALAQKSKVQKQDGLRFYQHTSIGMPFTFFRNIFLNRENVSPQIVDHELTHAQQWHSVDNLLAELYAILFWFNPLSWHYKNELTLNLEYLADEGALQYGHAQQNYQLQLLKASICETHYALANHFAQSIIKKRIKMMNTKPSSNHKQWRYGLFIPALAMAFLISNCQQNIEEKEVPEKTTASTEPVEVAKTISGFEIQEVPDGPAGSVEPVEVAITEASNGDAKLYNFASIDKKPQFPGGNDKIMGYAGKHFKYPEAAKKGQIQGMILVKFTIEKDGSVSDVKAVRGKDLGGGLAEEAVRVVKNFPTWEPGINNGERVRVSYTIPIIARLK